MDSGIAALARRAFSLAWRRPRTLFALARLAAAQGAAARSRAENRARGIPVPAFMILSVTRKCNLRCTGCYSRVTEAREQKEGRPGEMDAKRLTRLIREGADLGVSFVLVAGGEPLVRAQEIFDAARSNPTVAFPVFTNGTLIDDSIVKKLSRRGNVIPVLSVEGRREATDGRRGGGVWETALNRMAKLRRAGVFFGVSFTVMRSNAQELVSRPFVEELFRSGASIFFYNEYTPVEAGTESLCLDTAQRLNLLAELELLRREFPALFLAFPGDEDKYGGCLSASRGFVHIAPDGRLEACPFAPFGDSSARETSLAEALRSPLLAAIRDHHGELQETSGGCALWNRRDWAESLLDEAATDPAADAAAAEKSCEPLDAVSAALL